jgi:ACT domain-containing protein
MKGMMNLLERAGLVQREDDVLVPDAVQAPIEPEQEQNAPLPSWLDPDGKSTPAGNVPLSEVSGLSLDQIYAQAGVAVANYPAERFLRLLDGLKAMDEAIRRQVIAAMDAADDTWTIADPLQDAGIKIAAIEAHAATLRAGITLAEQETQDAVSGVQTRQETSVSEIRRQISDLEGLLARELARGAQENAALAAALQSKKDGADRELEQLMRTVADFRALVAQFKSAGVV